MDTATNSEKLNSQAVNGLLTAVVAADAGPMQRVQQRLREDMIELQLKPAQLATYYGLHPMQVKRALNGTMRFSEDVIRAVLHEEWHEYRVIAPAGVYNADRDFLVLQPAPEQSALDDGLPRRVCPITGRAFVPRHPNQRYHCMTTSTQRRNYRRLVEKNNRPWNTGI